MRVRLFLILCLLKANGRLTESARGEDWSGYEGGNLHHNASRIDVDPTSLTVVWQRVFDNPIPTRHSESERRSFGSRNLVTLDRYMALVGKDRAVVGSGRFVTILDRATGRVVNTIDVVMTRGRNHIDDYAPAGMYDDSHDVGAGSQMLAWDPSTGVLIHQVRR